MSRLVPAKRSRSFAITETIKALPEIKLSPELATNYDLLYDEIEACYRIKKMKLDYGCVDISKQELVEAEKRLHMILNYVVAVNGSAVQSSQNPLQNELETIRQELETVKRELEEANNKIQEQEQEMQRLRLQIRKHANSQIFKGNAKSLGLRIGGITMPYNAKGEQPNFKVPQTVRELLSTKKNTIVKLANFYEVDLNSGGNNLQGMRVTLNHFLSSGTGSDMTKIEL